MTQTGMLETVVVLKPLSRRNRAIPGPVTVVMDLAIATKDPIRLDDRCDRAGTLVYVWPV
jgi:hypothetical protein